MTDRLKGVVVTFEQDIREDDAEVIMNAIAQLRHVVSVQPVKCRPVDEMINREQIRFDLSKRLMDVLREDRS